MLIFLMAIVPAEADVIYSDHVAKLAKMLSQGKIKETDNKEHIFDLCLELSFKRTFKDLKLGCRIDENATIWRLIEDDGHFVLFGSVYSDANTGYLFVWVMKNNIKTLDTVFLQVGNEVIQGREYPKGVVPRNSWF